MKSQTKIRVKTEGSKNELQMLIRHPMRPAHDGQPADMIDVLEVTRNGVAEAHIYCSEHIAENPLFAVGLCDGVTSGDRFGVRWAGTGKSCGDAEIEIG